MSRTRQPLSRILFPYTTLFRSVRACCVAALFGCADRVLLARPDARVVPGGARACARVAGRRPARVRLRQSALSGRPPRRSEEHTAELQSHSELVCRLLLEKTNT